MTKIKSYYMWTMTVIMALIYKSIYTIKDFMLGQTILSFLVWLFLISFYLVSVFTTILFMKLIMIMLV